MEFRGTKGKWEARLKGQIASAVYCDNTQICMRAKSTTEAKADMLLISKAPEMLEMIEELIHQFEYNNNSSQEVDLLNEAKQLIKEATEL